MTQERARILVVDDDADARGLVRLILEAEGYTVDTAADALEALSRMQSADVDLVLLDLMLPGLDGLELCRRLRALGRERYVPILMVSALSRTADRHAGFAAGADDYVTKPFSCQEVVDRVQVWLRTCERLRVAHERVLREHERLRQAAESVAREETLVAVAATMTQELAQPLVNLVTCLDSWEASRRSQPDDRALHRALQEAAGELVWRIDTMARATRYASRRQAIDSLIERIRPREESPELAASR